MILSYGQLRHEWIVAGGMPKEADTAAAVAMAESHGNMHAINASDPYGGSFCAWQVNGVHPFDMHALLHDPYLCAMAAVYVHHESGWNAWSTYAQGKYLAYLPHHGHHVALFSSTHIQRAHRVAKAHHGHVQPPPRSVRSENIGMDFFLMCFALFVCIFSMRALRDLTYYLRVRSEKHLELLKHAKRKRARREEAALARRTMPRARRRTALA